MRKGATRGPPGDVQDCGETGHAPSPPPRHRAERWARAKAGPGDRVDDSRLGRGSSKGISGETARRPLGKLDCEPGSLLYIEQSCYLVSVRPHVTRAKIRAPSPVLAIVLLAILVMASAVLGWLGGLVAWLIVLGALAVFAFCLRGRP